MTPVGSDVKVRSAAVMVEKLTALLKVTVTALGVTVTVAPFAGLVEATRSKSTALIAATASTRPKPDCEFQVPGGRAVHRQGRLFQALTDFGRCELRDLLEHQGRHGRSIGSGRRRAEEDIECLLVRGHEVHGARRLAGERRVGRIEGKVRLEERGVAAIRGRDRRVLHRLRGVARGVPLALKT